MRALCKIKSALSAIRNVQCGIRSALCDMGVQCDMGEI